MSEQCKDCRFWEKMDMTFDSRKRLIGFCTEHVVALCQIVPISEHPGIAIGNAAGFVRVPEDFGCGRHQPKLTVIGE